MKMNKPKHLPKGNVNCYDRQNLSYIQSVLCCYHGLFLQNL